MRPKTKSILIGLDSTQLNFELLFLLQVDYQETWKQIFDIEIDD